MEINTVGVELLHADRRTDKHDEVLFAIFLTGPINSNTTQRWSENIFLIYTRQPCYSLSSESFWVS